LPFWETGTSSSVLIFSGTGIVSAGLDTTGAGRVPAPRASLGSSPGSLAKFYNFSVM